MHVLAFEDKPTLFAGGEERSLFEVCRGLSGRGIDISLAYHQSGELLSEYRKFVITATHLPSGAFCVKKVPRFSWDFLRAVCGRLRWGWDVLYVNRYFDIPFAALLGRLSRLPVVCHLRIAAPHYLSHQYRWGLMNCERLIANSEFTAATYTARGIPNSKIRVIYNGIDTTYFRPSPSSTIVEVPPRRRIIYLGRIAPGKGLETLIEAFRRATERNPRLSLNVIGNMRGNAVPPDYLERLKALAGTLLDKSIAFLPHVADVRSHIASSDLLVLPSEYGEPFGRVLIESMACGVPVVATDDGGIPEVLLPRFVDHIVPTNDARALADAIIRHTEWRRSNPELGKRCRSWAMERFGHNRYFEQVLMVLTEAIRLRPEKRGISV